VTGARVTFIAMAGYRVLEAVMNDNAMLDALIGDIADDVVKIVAGVGMGRYMILAGASMATTLTLGSLIGVVIGCVVFPAVADYYASKQALTAQLASAIDSMIGEIAAHVKNKVDVLGGRVNYRPLSAIDIAIGWLTAEESGQGYYHLKQRPFTLIQSR